MRRRRCALVAAAAITIAGGGTAVIATPVAAYSAPDSLSLAGPAVRTLSTSLLRTTHGTARFAVRPATGEVTFVGGSSAHPLQPALPPGDNDDAGDAAREFVDQYGAMFGVADAPSELTQLGASSSDSGDAVRFQQTFDSVPVIAGVVAVQVDDTGAVVAATGEASPQLDLTVSAAISADAASATAVALTAKYDAVAPDALLPSAAQLSIYDPSLLGGADDGRGPRIVWRVEVSTALGDVDRLVLIDANDGTIALQFSQREDAKNRSVCDNKGVPGVSENCTNGAAVITEANQASTYSGASADARSAFDLAGVTYDFYAALGRDGVDGQGGLIKSTVRFCPPSGAGSCPYSNAYWGGTQMVYGAGYAQADDVVGHELTHGVTEHTSGLFYYADAGSINESISDVMGELIDQSSVVSGADPPPDLWKIGEQIPGGALRSMSNPPSFGDPDRMTSNLIAATPSDNYGVHTNSGVGNKAAYLIANGGTFNGQTIVGIGNTKTANLYYELESLLTAGSDYIDLSNALPQACTILANAALAGITAADCGQVTAAVLATEMNLRATKPGAFRSAPICDTVGAQTVTEFSDDMEANTGAWAASTTGSSSPWGYSTAASQSGVRSVHVEDLSAQGTAALTMQNPVAIPAGSTSFLRFDHSFSTDADLSRAKMYEGGVVEFTTNGSTWTDISGLGGTVNGYVSGSTITAGFGNPLQGRPAFGYDSPNFETTRVDLSSLAGQSIRFRFVLGTDSLPSGAPGWFVDDVSIYSCADIPTAPTILSAAPGPGSAVLTWSAPASSGGLPIAGYVVIPSIGGIAQPGVMVPATTAYTVTGLTAGTGYTFTVAASTSVGPGPASAPSATVVPFAGFTPLAPVRLLETRDGRTTVDGQFNGIGLRDPGSTTALRVTGRGNIPADAAAVVLNVTVTEAQAPGYVTVFPCGAAPPTASNVNYVVGSTIPNAVVVKVGTDGQVCLFTQSAVHLVVDASGSFPAGASLIPLVPGRVLDSRSGQPTVDGQASGIGVRPAGSITQVLVSGRAGVPSDAAAVAVNVTVTEAQGVGYATVYPCGSDPPLASNLNYVTGATIANLAITKIGAGGMICIFTQAAVHAIVDVNGYIPAAATIVPMIPARVLDTRGGHATIDGIASGLGLRTPGSVTVVQIATRATVPPSSTAVVLNVTVTESAAPGYATVYPCGGDPPTASNLNYGIGTTIANAVITPLAADGTVCIYTQSAVHLVADVDAYITG